MRPVVGRDEVEDEVGRDGGGRADAEQVPPLVRRVEERRVADERRRHVRDVAQDPHGRRLADADRREALEVRREEGASFGRKPIRPEARRVGDLADALGEVRQQEEVGRLVDRIPDLVAADDHRVVRQPVGVELARRAGLLAPAEVRHEPGVELRLAPPLAEHAAEGEEVEENVRQPLERPRLPVEEQDFGAVREIPVAQDLSVVSLFAQIAMQRQHLQHVAVVEGEVESESPDFHSTTHGSRT